MIKFSVLYPVDPNAEFEFDFDYYQSTHAPLVRRLVGPALVGIELQKGLSGIKSSTAPDFGAIATLTFRSRDDLKAHLYPHLKEISADIPRFTPVSPQILVTEIVE